MATTESGHHRLEVESLTAKAVANKILSTMDVDPDEVVRFEVTIECESKDGETETVIESEGPAAGQIVSPMLQHTDWDSEEPRRIKVHVVTTEAEEGNEHPEDEVVEVVEDEVVDEDIAPSVSVGTNAHAGLTSMAAYIWKKSSKTVDGDGYTELEWTSEKPGISVAMIIETVELDLNKDQLSDALDYCRDRGLIENVGEDGPGTTNYYHLRPEGWMALRASGRSDMVEEFPLNEMLQSRLGGASEGFTQENVERGEYGREEPDVDEPKPVKPGTRPHQALTILKKLAEEYGDDHWVSAEGVYKFPKSVDWPNQTAASRALSGLFLDHAMCERVRESGGGRMRCLYRINEVGRRELNRVGEAEI